MTIEIDIILKNTFRYPVKDVAAPHALHSSISNYLFHKSGEKTLLNIEHFHQGK